MGVLSAESIKKVELCAHVYFDDDCPFHEIILKIY